MAVGAVGRAAVRLAALWLLQLLLLGVVIKCGASTTSSSSSSSSSSPSSSTTTSSAGGIRACLQHAEVLGNRNRHAASAARYTQCSTLTNNSMEAGLALFLASQVERHRLKNITGALEAAHAGWRVSQAAELACALAELTLDALHRPREATDWAHKAIAAGCVRGSCRSVMRAYFPGAKAAPCAWWQPYAILHRLAASAAADGSSSSSSRSDGGDAAHKAYVAVKVAQAAALYYNHNQTAYLQLGPPLPLTPRVEQPGACGTAPLPDSVLRMAAAAADDHGSSSSTLTLSGGRRPQLHILALASNTSVPGFTKLLASADHFGLTVTPLSPPSEMGHEAGGKFGLRLQAMASHLNLLHEDDVVIAIDAYDVLLAGGERRILSGFVQALQALDAAGGSGSRAGQQHGWQQQQRQAPRDVALFAAESGIWPDLTLAPKYPHPGRKYRFLNAGAYMGTVRALRCVYAAAATNLTDSRFSLLDDQLALTLAYLATVNSSAPLVALDYGHRVFAGLYDSAQGWDFKPTDWERRPGVGWASRLTGGVPSILHANGRQGVKWMHSQLLHDVLTGFQAGNGSAAAAGGGGAPAGNSTPSSSSASTHTQPAAVRAAASQQLRARAAPASLTTQLAWARPASHLHVLLFVACAAAMALATACMTQLVLSGKSRGGGGGSSHGSAAAGAAVRDAGPVDLEQQRALIAAGSRAHHHARV